MLLAAVSLNLFLKEETLMFNRIKEFFKDLKYKWFDLPKLRKKVIRKFDNDPITKDKFLMDLFVELPDKLLDHFWTTYALNLDGLKSYMCFCHDDVRFHFGSLDVIMSVMFMMSGRCTFHDKERTKGTYTRTIYFSPDTGVDKTYYVVTKMYQMIDGKDTQVGTTREWFDLEESPKAMEAFMA